MQFQINPSKFFLDMDKLTLMFVWRGRKPRILDGEGEVQSRRTDSMTSRSTLQLQVSRLHSVGERVGNQITATE
jgi:hypothetical protein